VDVFLDMLVLLRRDTEIAPDIAIFCGAIPTIAPTLDRAFQIKSAAPVR
jgi:hypothetical protein